MLSLSTKQQEIVNHLDGAILVKAGPGSGKTRVLIERVKKLLLIKKRSKILTLTFSNLAADEIKNRLNDDPSIVDYIDNVYVGTIHSFCLDLVQTRGNLLGLENDIVLFENTTDRQAIIKDVLLDDPALLNNTNIKNTLSDHKKITEFIQYCLDKISDQKKNFISPDMCTLEDPIPQIYSGYCQKLLTQNALDFDDILFFAYRILTENQGVVRLYNSLYKYICIDEAQDLNFAQYQVIRALCGNEFKNIMMVGDEKQSIYAFNGSDSSLMTSKFVEDFKPTTTYSLNENFRSAKSIVKFANRLGHYDSTANYVYNGELKAFSFINEEEEAEYVKNRILELIKNGNPDIDKQLSYNDFAIIARNKYVFKYIEQSLIKHSIPFFYKKSGTGIENESDYMFSFDLAMRIIINNKDLIHLRKLSQLLKVPLNDNRTYSTGFEILSKILSNSIYINLLPALEILQEVPLDFTRSIKCLEKNLPDFDDGERYLVMNDIRQWRTHWVKYCSQVRKENRTLASFRNCVSLGKTQDISPDHGVELLTAHMSKGLQFEAVFIIGLTEGTFPDYRAIRARGKELEQEKNNMYVAVTRAKRLCYLTYPKQKLMPWGDRKYQEPSRYIADIIKNNND